jgi:hypothetical protein
VVPTWFQGLRGQLGEPSHVAGLTLSNVLHEGVIYRHIILTVPAMFRPIFYQNAAKLVSALMRCGVRCLDDFYSEVRGKRLKGG